MNCEKYYIIFSCRYIDTSADCHVLSMFHRYLFWQQALDLQNQREEAMAKLADEKNKEIEVGRTLFSTMFTFHNVCLIERNCTPSKEGSNNPE